MIARHPELVSGVGLLHVGAALAANVLEERVISCKR